jgi:hypothetical protein
MTNVSLRGLRMGSGTYFLRVRGLRLNPKRTMTTTGSQTGTCVGMVYGWGVQTATKTNGPLLEQAALIIWV